jgi:hypothetical protein
MMRYVAPAAEQAAGATCLSITLEDNDMSGHLISATLNPVYHTLNSCSLLPAHIEQTAFYSYGEYAWRKEDLAEVFAYCLAASVAIASGEGWVVRGRETGPYVVYRIVPQRGGCTAVFSWHNNWSEQTQSWQSYVADTVERASCHIEQAQFEANILPEYAPCIYYKLTFEHQDGLCF